MCMRSSAEFPEGCPGNTASCTLEISTKTCAPYSKITAQALFASFRWRLPDHSVNPLLSFSMPSRYAQWMHDWETRLTSVDNNRVVRPLDWGIEWMQDWPCGNGCAPADTSDQCERFLQEYNRRIVSASDEFYSYVKPSDFQLERREVQVFSTREV